MMAGPPVSTSSRRWREGFRDRPGRSHLRRPHQQMEGWRKCVSERGGEASGELLAYATALCVPPGDRAA